MSSITLPNISADVLAIYADRAARSKRTVEEEVLAVVEGRSEPISIAEPSASKNGLQSIPSEEIWAPFDLFPTTPGERIYPRECGPSKLEFWFDEDKVVE